MTAATEARPHHVSYRAQRNLTQLRAPLNDRLLGALMASAGTIGLVLAATLLIEKIRLIEDPTYLPTCSLNPVLSCGSIMTTPQAELFGFPNPIIGLAAFSVVVTSGVAILGDARLPHWFWTGLLAGATAGVVFVHWLAFQSIYRIGALCPYCIGVWLVTIAVFWYLGLRAAVRRVERRVVPGRSDRVVEFAIGYHGVILTLWYLGLAVPILLEFWDYWSTLA